MGIVWRPQRRGIGRATVAAAVAACGAVMLVLANAAATRTIAASPQPHQSTAIQPADLEPRARAVCGSCHAYPPPDILPRDSWRDEFVRMMFIREGRTPPLGPPGIVNRNVTLPQDMEQVLPFYVS